MNGARRVDRLVVDGERALVRVDVACARSKKWLRARAWHVGVAGSLVELAVQRGGRAPCARRVSPANTMFTLAACSIGSSVWRMSSPSPLVKGKGGGRTGWGKREPHGDQPSLRRASGG